MTTPPSGPIRRRDWLVSIGLLICGVSIVFLGIESFSVRRGGDQLPPPIKGGSDLRAELARAKSELAANLTEVDRLRLTLEAQQPPPAARAEEDARAAGQLFLAEHPEARGLAETAMLTLARSWPARSGRAAGFSEEEIARWTALFVRQKGAPFYHVGGVTPDFGDLDSSKVQGELLKEIVGDARFAEYEAQRATLYGHNEAARIAYRAQAAGAPLTPAQTEALATIFGHGNLNRASEWERSAQAAAGLLSPAQQAIFDLAAANHRALEQQSKYRESLWAAKK